MVVGNIEGYDVDFNPVNDTVTCKQQVVPVTNVLRAYESALDRYNLRNDLVMRRQDGIMTLGCLSLTIEHSKQLIKAIKNARITKKN